MKFISLMDTRTSNIITVDAEALTLRLEIDGAIRETRLKTYHADILYELFSMHPNPMTYSDITKRLKTHHLSITDVTRMHRKLSEVRSFLGNFHPPLCNLVLNTRSIGYSLPLQLKNMHALEHSNTIKFKNPKIIKSIDLIGTLIENTIVSTSRGKVIKHSQGFVLNRAPFRQILVDNIADFNKATNTILKEIRSHEAEFSNLRIQYLLAKLRTYIGLARISEYAISETQWLDWFKQEVWMLFDDLQKSIKMTES